MRAAWWGITLLALLAVTSAVIRATSLINPQATLTRSFEKSLLSIVTNDETRVAGWIGELREVDARFAAHRPSMLLHVTLGGIFLLLAPLQFSARIRSRHPRFHRWSGLFLVACAIPSALLVTIYGVRYPHGGAVEASATAVFGTFFLFAITRAVIAIRRRDIARHREWMIRAFAVAIGVETIRLFGPMLLILHPTSIAEMIGVSFWLGWSVTVAAAEVWIRMTAVAAAPVAQESR
jgi:hypothetical protein